MKTTFLLIHGWASNKTVFAPVEEKLLKKGFKVEYLDYSKQINFQNYFDIEIKKKLQKNKNIIPVAWSMAGFLLLDNILNKKSYFKKTVLLSTALNMTEKSNILKIALKVNKRIALAKFYSMAIMDKRNFKYLKNSPKPDSFDINWLLKGLDYLDKVNLVSLASKINKIVPESLSFFMKIKQIFFKNSFYTDIKIIHGSHDKIIPIKSAKIMQKLLPNSKLYIMKTGHAPFLEDLDGFIELLLK